MSRSAPSCVISACQIDGKLITSPNMTSIPLPPWHRHGVRARADQRFGHDDFTLWPQFYCEDYDYLTAIPRKPQDPSGPLALLWSDIAPEDFIPHIGSSMDGFGSLSDAKRSAFDCLRTQFLDRVKPHLSRNQDPFVGSLLTMVKLMNHSCVRIGELSSTLQDLRFIVAEFQRYALEVYGMLEYNEIYFNRSARCSSQGRPPTSVANALGAFTSSDNVATLLFFAGLPVYLIRENGPMLNTVIQHSNLTPISPEGLLCFDDSQPPHPVIYETSGTEADVKRKIDEIHGYSRIWMYFDPENARFDALELVPNGLHIITLQKLIASRSATTTSSKTSSLNFSRPKKAPKPSAGRDPFIVVDTPFFPNSSPVWSHALKAVDRHPNQLLTDHKTNPSHGCFALPDPHLLFHHGDTGKIMAYLLAWLRARPSLIYQARKQLALTQRAQTWRQFLEMLGRGSATSDTSNTALVREKIRATYAFLISESNFTVASELSHSNLPVKWRGIPLTLAHKPAGIIPIFREVTWELNESNFRLEFFCLDCLASTLDFLPRRRIQRISKCFEPEEFLPVSLPIENTGLVADDWRGRVPFMLAFVDVMRSWGVAPAIFKLSHNELDGQLDKAKLEQLEAAATGFYCQKFFAWFGRAASIPCRLHIRNSSS